MKSLSIDQFETLLSLGHIVPRYKDTGEPMPFAVGQEYTVKCDKDTRRAKVRCTQNCPYHLILIEQPI